MPKITVDRYCVVCGKPSHVEVDEDTYLTYMADKRDGKSAATHDVQVLFPDLSSGDRDILISGTHDECWNEISPPDDWLDRGY